MNLKTILFLLTLIIVQSETCIYSIFRSLDRLILNFSRFIVQLKPLLSCKIADIAMKRSFLLAKGGNNDIMRPEPKLVYVTQYNLHILVIVVVIRKINQVLGLKCINTWFGFFIQWIRGQIGDYVLCLYMLILGIYRFYDL